MEGGREENRAARCKRQTSETGRKYPFTLFEQLHGSFGFRQHIQLVFGLDVGGKMIDEDSVKGARSQMTVGRCAQHLQLARDEGYNGAIGAAC